MIAGALMLANEGGRGSEDRRSSWWEALLLGLSPTAMLEQEEENYYEPLATFPAEEEAPILATWML